MAEVYVTLGEAAELERVKYNTMVKRVLRKQESFVTKTEKSENGGKDVVLVAVSSLSKQARNAWKEREKLKSFTEEFPDKKEDEQKPEVPWYVNTDVDWYIENYKERYYKAVELGNVVRKFLQYDEGDRTKYAEEFAQKYLGKGQRTLYRYTKACSHEMLPVHGADRRLTRYEGEHPENFRSRIAMYEEICKLGGTNEGVLLAVRTLGYTSPVLVRANDLTGFSHFTLDGSWLLDGSRTLESDTIENRWAEFYIVIVMDADEEHPISFDIMRKTVRKWKEVGAKDNYFFKYNLSIRQPHTGNFLEVLYKKHLFYYDYRKLDGMWKLDGSYMLDAEMTPVGTRIGYRYESLYELHEAGLAVMAYNYACRMVESAILKAAYSFRMYYFEYLKTDGSWITDGSHVVDAEMSPREMRWSTTFHHQHEEELLLKQRYRMQPCEEEYSIRKTLERYRMVIDYFDYLKLNGLWKLTGSRLMDAQRTEYTTKQAYSFGVEHTREFRVIWHEEHNLIFLDGTRSLDGSKIIDAWQKTEVL